MGYGNACRAFDTSAAKSLYQDALALAKELGDERAVATLFLELALIAFEQDDYDECARLMDEGQTANERTRSPAVELMRLETMGQLARYRDGDLELARELVGQALNVARAAGLAFWEAEEARMLAGIERAAGRLDIAEAHAGDSLERSSEIRHRTAVILALASLAWIARAAGRDERAGLLWGAVDAEVRRAPIAGDPGAWETAGSADAGPVFERARRAGSVLSLDEAVAYALTAEADSD